MEGGWGGRAFIKSGEPDLLHPSLFVLSSSGLAFHPFLFGLIDDTLDRAAQYLFALTCLPACSHTRGLELHAKGIMSRHSVGCSYKPGLVE